MDIATDNLPIYPAATAVHRQTLRALVAYGLAGLIGLTAVCLVFPDWYHLWRMPPGAPRSADFAQHVLGGRYFLAEAWHPHLMVQGLDAPFGVPVGLTDSLPLLLLLLKPFAPLLPADFQAVTGGLAGSWVLQPIAAVFLLRSMNELRLLPALAVAVFAIATPTFLLRVDHEALTAHFTLMLAAGLSLRIVDPTRRGYSSLLAGGLLLIPLLLIHPYLMLIAASILLAAPLTLLLRRDHRWIAAAIGFGASLGVTVALADWLHYTGPGAATDGFGLYSMNLLSPVWPYASRLFHTLQLPPMDATGGQYEGYQYLGAGVLLACAIIILSGSGRRAAGAALRRHPGLVLACVSLTILALSNRVYLGHWLLATWPAPQVTGIIRASGRLFWPIVYLAEVGAVAILARLPARAAVPLLVVLPLLQLYDASELFHDDEAQLHKVTPLPFDAARLQRVMAASRLLVVLPPWPCEATRTGAIHLMDVLYVAGRTLLPTNTMYTSRATHPPQCDLAGTMRRPLAPGELRVLLPGHADLTSDLADATALCRRLDTLTLCAADPGLLDGLPPIAP